jgi:hypothetical protein
MKRIVATIVIVAIVAIGAAALWRFTRSAKPATASGAVSEAAAGRMQQKLDAIVAHAAGPPKAKAQPLTTTLSEEELNSYFQYRMGAKIPRGVSQIRFQLHAGRVTGEAMVDFDEVKASSNRPIHPLLDALLAGKRPVSGTGSFTSSNGSGVLHLEQVAIGNLSLSGALLDLLVRRFVLPRYPKAAIDRPFQLPAGIDRLVIEEGRAIIYQK